MVLFLTSFLTTGWVCWTVSKRHAKYVWCRDMQHLLVGWGRLTSIADMPRQHNTYAKVFFCGTILCNNADPSSLFFFLSLFFKARVRYYNQQALRGLKLSLRGTEHSNLQEGDVLSTEVELATHLIIVWVRWNWSVYYATSVQQGFARDFKVWKIQI